MRHTMRAFARALSDAPGVHALQMFTIRREQARIGELKPVVERLLSDRDETFAWGPVLALLNCEIGMTGAAREEFERSASAGFDRIPRDARWVVTVVHLVEVCAYLGDETRALALYKLLEPHNGHNIVTEMICLGAADRYLGILAATRHDWTTVEHHYENALAFNNSSALPIWRAHAFLDFAGAPIARHEDGDQKRATELIDQALAAAETLALESLRDNCLALLSEKPSEGPLADGLSRGELKVLRLLASGATNRAIAEKLFVSHNTVATHVRHILAKTNSANRTEAANYARHHSLVGDE